MARDSAVLQARVGAHVRNLRLGHQWSQEELAARAELSYKFVGEIERGIANPTLGTLAALARAFDIHVSALLADSPTEDTDEYPLSREEFIAVREAKESLESILTRLAPLQPRGDRKKRSVKRRVP
jgi:transcriptional regulator with XRE-family HTH domain